MAVVWKRCSGEVCSAIWVAVEAGDRAAAGAVADSVVEVASAAAVVVVGLAAALVAAVILALAAQEVIGEDFSTGRP